MCDWHHDADLYVRYEVNSISWADGAASPTFASVADDLTVRVWRADQAEVELAAQEPKDEGWA